METHVTRNDEMEVRVLLLACDGSLYSLMPEWLKVGESLNDYHAPLYGPPLSAAWEFGVVVTQLPPKQLTGVRFLYLPYHRRFLVRPARRA